MRNINKEFGKIVFLVICSFFVFVTCSTLPVPRSEDSTLVVGEIRLIESNEYLPVRGMVNSEVKIRFRSIETDTIIDVYPRSQCGLFRTTELPEGIYEIVECVLERKISNEKEERQLNLNQEINSRYFTVIKNKINNLGLIIWAIEDDNMNVVFFGAHDSVKNHYYEHFAQTGRDEWAYRDFPVYYYRNIDERLTRNYVVSGDDSSRYQDLWIFWHLIAEERVGRYPLPYKNETVKDWVTRNAYLIPSTTYGPVIQYQYNKIEDIELVEFRFDEDTLFLKRIADSDTNTSFLFRYSGTNNENFGSIFVYFLRRGINE